MKKVITLCLLISSFLYSLEVPLTKAQKKEVEILMSKETKDYTKYGFSEKEKREFFQVGEYLLSLESEKNIPEELWDRYDILDKKYEKAKKSWAKDKIVLNSARLKKPNIKFLKMVIKRGADVNVTDENNESALSWAAYLGKEEVTKILLEAGANPFYENHSTTVVELTAERGHKNILELFTRYNVSRKQIIDAMKRAINEKKETLEQEKIILKKLNNQQRKIKELNELFVKKTGQEKEIKKFKPRTTNKEIKEKKKEIKELQKLYCVEPELKNDDVCKPLIDS